MSSTSRFRRTQFSQRTAEVHTTSPNQHMLEHVMLDSFIWEPNLKARNMVWVLFTRATNCRCAQLTSY